MHGEFDHRIIVLVAKLSLLKKMLLNLMLSQCVNDDFGILSKNAEDWANIQWLTIKQLMLYCIYTQYCICLVICLFILFDFGVGLLFWKHFNILFIKSNAAYWLQFALLYWLKWLLAYMLIGSCIAKTSRFHS